MKSAQQRLKEILSEAVARTDPAERAAYLGEACAQDSALRSKLETLIRAYERHGDALEQPLGISSPVVEGPGTIIGRYKLLEQIGEGGFGIVFMAEQTQPIRRRVALKIIKPGMDTRQVIGRFEAEQQALAMMDHPNIARVFDAGATDAGRPFFVMELVQGVPITEFCDANDLTPQERLKIFMTVCEAVQHAHQKGIIHRDLKPSNILVTLHDGKPVPKVIDFGTAKALQHPLTEKTLFTAYGRLIGTPQYMSPEQAEMSGLDVDTRADIYSLGVLLYELLTGTTPFEAERLRTAAFDEMMRIIRQEEPAKPSTRVSTLGARATDIARRRQVDEAVLRRTLQGDLDWIVMKALEKDRTRRYQAASALAEDLQRHLDHHPVQAGPPGAGYRSRKFIRRHRVGVALAASVTTALLAGLLVATFAFIRANQERNRALRAEQLAEQHQQQAKTTLRRSDIRRARDFFAQDQADAGIALLALLLREDPADRSMAEWLMNELTGRTFPLPVAPPLQLGDSAHLAAFSPDGRRILTASRNNQAQVWDVRTAQPVSNRLTHDARLILGNEFQGGLHPLHAAFSPDGQRVATGATDNTAIIWDATTGRRLTRFLLHSNWVTYVAFSPDGRFLATACKDGSVRLWDAARGEALGSPLRHAAWVNFVKFSPDGRFLVTGSDDRTAQVWEVSAFQPVGVPLQHDREVRDAAFSPDGRRVVTASADHTARLWDARTGEPLCLPRQHDGQVVAACFSPDGALVATASFDKTARLWDGYDGHSLGRPLQHRDMVRSVKFSPEGQRVVTASQDKTARVWDARTGEPLTEPMRHEATVWSAEFSPDGRQVLTASADKTVRVWDVRPGQALGQVLPHANLVHFVHWSPDGRRVLAGTAADTLVWDANTGRPPSLGQSALRHQPGLLCARFSPDAQLIVSGHADGTARVWDGSGVRALTRRMQHAGPVHDVEFSPDGRMVATASADGTARLWSSDIAAPHGSPLQHQDAVLAARFSPDGKSLATASCDRTSRLWSAATGQPLTSPLRHEDQVLAVEFSPDGQWLVTACKDGSAQVWEVASGKPLGPPLKHRGPVNSAQFSPDGAWVVTASDDETARVWESRTGRPLAEPLDHHARVSWARFCSDGKRVLTASYDGTACLWDSRTGTPLRSPLHHSNRVEHAEFSPDGNWLATACDDYFARTWYVVKAGGAAPGWLPELAEAVAGERLNSERISETVAPAAWFRLREQLATLSGEDDYARWARWFLADRSTRRVAPGAERTVAQRVEDLLDPNRLLVPGWVYWPDYPDRLASAARLEPTNALVFAERACLVGQNPFVYEGAHLKHYQFTNQVRQLPTLNWLADRAVSLGPDQAISWTAQALCLALAGQTNAALGAFERGRSFASKDPFFWLAWAGLLERWRFEGWTQNYTNGVAVATATLPEALRLDATLEGRYRLNWGLSDRHRATFSALNREVFLKIPSRASDCPPGLIDLNNDHLCYNLDRSWLHRDPARLDLTALPHGRTRLGGMEFDVRCIRGWVSSPKEWETRTVPIPVGQACRRLHFLHATDLPEPEGTLVASYVVHYRDGQQREVPVLYGKDVLAWLLETEPPPRTQPPVAWRHDAGGGMILQLYRLTWENPLPDVPIERLDFNAKMTEAAPFLVGLTAE